MTRTSKAKIFLAEERGIEETACFSSRYTFNFALYFNDHRQRQGDIYVVNDDVLEGGKSLSVLVQENSFILLIPVAGAISLLNRTGDEEPVAAGQVKMLYVEEGTTLCINNPFSNEQVNFIQVWIKTRILFATPESITQTFYVNESINKLVTITPETMNNTPLAFTGLIGKFTGRGETVYQLQQKSNGVFVFVVEGAFEVDGRLLHAGDGLALWDTPGIEMEALSNNALLLLIEQWH